MVSQESLLQFKRIYKQEYGVDLPDDQAFELANNLSNLYRAVYLNPKNNQMNQYYEKKPQPTHTQS
ncbi:MAG: hypothetical protein ABI425_04290 [Patescibacteria group bacterium]